MGRNTAFGQELARLRAVHGLSLQQLGAQAHYSRSFIHDLEHGVKQPSPTMAKRLDNVLSAGGRLAALAEQRRAELDDSDTELVADQSRRSIEAGEGVLE